MFVLSSTTITGKLLRGILPALLLLACVSCRKQDIEPEPVGEAVPYDGPTRTLQQVLEKSPYTLFYAAWKRANMDAHLDAEGANTFTVLAPTDKALQQAGWTAEKINQASPETLDTLLSYYVTNTEMRPASLASIAGNVPLSTLLKSGDVPNYSADLPYNYKLFAGVYNDSLVINGLAVAKWGTALAATTATIYPVEKMLPLPKMDMLAFLQSDERFSLFLEACRINDSLYIDHDPWNLYLQNLPLLTAQPMTGGQFTLIAPTNNAFHKSGFNTVEDIRAYSVKSLPIGEPDYNDEYYYVYPSTAMDSILMPYRMDYVGDRGPANGIADMNPAFYYNDLLLNKGVSGMMLKIGAVYNNAPQYYRLQFINSNGEVKVKRLGSSAAPLPLSQTNIQVLNGVVHVVDEGLLMP